MDEKGLRKNMANEIMEVQFLPTITETSLKEVKYEKYPIKNLSALGVASESVVSAMQSLGGKAGKSGIYRVNTNGMEMFKSRGGYIGALKAADGGVGGGQAIIEPLACNPTMLFMSMALMTIENKLDEIKSIQQEILDFVKSKEKAKIRVNLNTLIDVLNNYKFNCDNEKYKTNKHILVQDIKRNSEQSILLYRDLIQTTMCKKELIHSDQEIKSKIKKLDENLKEYQLALYLYSFSSFLEVMLLENFNKNYISGVREKISEYEFNYKELYTRCYNEIESSTGKSIQSVLTKGLANASKGTGELISRIPFVSKGQVDEFLIDSEKKIKKFNEKRNDKNIQKLVANSIKGANPFVESLNKVNIIYNEPIEILMDKNNLYLVEGEN